LDKFDWALEKSTGQDFAALLAVPRADLLTKFWSPMSEFKLGDPKIKEQLESYLADAERKDTAKKQLERLLAEAERQHGIERGPAKEPAAPPEKDGGSAAAAAAAAPGAAAAEPKAPAKTAAAAKKK
jgi:hypothetical protein